MVEVFMARDRVLKSEAGWRDACDDAEIVCDGSRKIGYFTC